MGPRLTMALHQDSATARIPVGEPRLFVEPDRLETLRHQGEGGGSGPRPKLRTAFFSQQWARHCGRSRL